MRTAEITRETKETTISCCLDLDGSGNAEIRTGIGFLDHMLELLAFHSGMDLRLDADGDLDVDDHHTVEDCGIVLGTAFRKALGERRGINRYGFFTLPMDESLAESVIDISGRPYLVFQGEFRREMIGLLATEMIEEFLRAFAVSAGVTLHVRILYGSNDHHKAEAVFKSLGRALRQAVNVNGDQIPSTKGSLE